MVSIPQYEYRSPNRRARDLLESLLNKKQRFDLEHFGYFECTGSLGTPYKIRVDSGHSFNISWTKKNGVPGGYFCAYPRPHPKGDNRYGPERLPPYDLIVGQFLALVTDEKNFLRKAHVSMGRYPPVGNLYQRITRWWDADLVVILGLASVGIVLAIVCIWQMVAMVLHLFM